MVTVENLEQELKTDKLNKSIYLLYGEETYLLENAVKKIKTKFGEIVDGINYIKIDETNVINIISDIETPSFGYEKKLIIAKNTGLFKKETKTKTSLLLEFSNKLKQYIEENIDVINKTCIIIFIEQEADKNQLYSIIDKYGEVCNFEAQKLPQIIGRIKYICNAYKVNIDEQTLKYFVECCGTNMQDLINEIRKLIEFAEENGTIKKEDIDLLSIKVLEAKIFDLTDNLGKKNIKQALEILKNLIYAKEPVQKILITLYNHFKKLYITKLAEKSNKNLAISLGLKPNQMFLTSKYSMQAKYFKEEELRAILEELINIDKNSKQGLIDLQLGLEAILCKYCS